MNLLEIRKLSARYGESQVLFDLDILVHLNEVIAIIGANGAGKSTLLRAIAGLARTERNSIVFAGEPIGGLRPYDVVAKGLALVPEGRRLFSSLSVEENLLMGTCSGRSGDWSLERVYSLFPRLRERRRQRAASMSGGEQQMVAIGRALMSNPRLLMCDELSLGLAPPVVEDIYAVLAGIKEQGATMIIVEQDIRKALSVADRMYCLQEGRVSLEGRPADLSHEQIARAYFGA